MPNAPALRQWLVTHCEVMGLGGLSDLSIVISHICFPSLSELTYIPGIVGEGLGGRVGFAEVGNFLFLVGRNVGSPVGNGEG